MAKIIRIYSLGSSSLESWAGWGKDGAQDKIRVSLRMWRRKETVGVRQVTSNVFSLFLHGIRSLVVKTEK